MHKIVPFVVFLVFLSAIYFLYTLKVSAEIWARYGKRPALLALAAFMAIPLGYLWLYQNAHDLFVAFPQLSGFLALAMAGVLVKIRTVLD